MEYKDTLQQVDQLIQSRSILCHPFYVAWKRGELTLDQLAGYARTYYPHVVAFPDYLRTAIDHSEDLLVRSELERNLKDELSNPKAHTELWLDFAESLGLERQDVASAASHPAAAALVDTYYRLTRQGDATALVALYAYESQQPEVALEKAKGLRQFYGLDNLAALAYFTVHTDADVHHREGERRALLRCLEKGADPQDVLDSAHQSLDAYWGLLDGICQEEAITLD